MDRTTIHPYQSSPSTQLQGYLLKEGGIYKSWKKRWFCIEGDSLKYYVNDTKTELKGSILLTLILHVRPVVNNNSNRNSQTITPSSITTTKINQSATSISVDISSLQQQQQQQNGNNNRQQLNHSGAALSTSMSKPFSMSGSFAFGSNQQQQQLDNAQQQQNTQQQQQQTQQEWIFNVHTQQRTYTFKVSEEVEMWRWVQGIRGIQLESKQKELESNKKEKEKEQKLNKSRNSLEYSGEMIKPRVEQLHYQVQEAKEHLKETRQEWDVFVKDYSTLLNVVKSRVQEQCTTAYRRSLLMSNSHHQLPNHNNHNHNHNHNQQRHDNNHPASPHGCDGESTLGHSQYSQQSDELNSNKAENGMALWYPDDSTYKCHSCLSIFTFFKRRHHCRNCGHLFCARCCNQEAKAIGYVDKVRVCQQCAQHLWTKHDKVLNVLSMSS
ncbi:hypothetical protein SAMD00019534_051220 [Acytostelium subglobosum LB1]|uniref:hypothetical protein n=1 Tax=Acytostelium subglobosum LB1 TaxID=1410327 RepID=UPI00064492AA|nr:hypothetical protein SAMD00019534_051220 [Acytostelium subglobosum LB1]GAM21947.1 hypothetical protein SAMD00019534_051220 [Acytostelium subglobosum LB1]|eukprot:XP_012755047.1 hypothetical protein SAMD00019534_051220 [Acytostelium subglobosum LB1]